MQSGATGRTTDFGYRPDIDGLRAVAVLAVVLYHAGVAGMPGGFVGVDVFFVISGYVIARGLMREARGGGIAIAAFYARRIRRILPALVATLLLASVAAYWILLPPQLEDYARSAVAASLSWSNIYFWRSSGYFDAASLYRPLLHTWSLSVEEQFYLLLPVSLLVAVRLQLRPLWLPFAVIAALSLGLSVYAGRAAPTANFYLLPTRAWELLVGTLLAMAPRPGLGALPPAAREALGLAGLAGILAPVLFYSEATPFPGLGALPPCLGAAVLIRLGEARAEAGRDAAATRLLAAAPLVAVGLISYSVYLVHWPLIVLSRIVLMRDVSAPETAAIVAATLALGALSYRFVERPFRRPHAPAPSPSRPQRLRPVFAAGFAATLAMAGLGWVAAASGGLPARFPEFRVRPVPGTETWNHRTCFLFADQTWQAWDQAACTRTAGKAGLVLLWGDSFAAHYVPGLIRHANRLPGNLVQYTAAGCRPTLGFASHVVPHCHAFNENALALIRRLGIRDVVLAARWGAQRDRAVPQDLRETVAQVAALGARVHVIGQSPEFPLDPAFLAYRQRHDPPSVAGRWRPVTDPRVNDALRAALPGGTTVIDPFPALCDAATCPYALGDTFLYADSGHFGSAGAALAVERFVEAGLFGRPRSTAMAP
ncbi:acyltransferase family protein [Methylobacterium nonmethylotrophicum]|uniref:Acyltransferase n=1 Tax=Methylobacterium nonmethylotrophicum TaxID=1141884 RepID=A0A4Z0NTZ1_9HYPH|nr:acyltransferase family protein [Methylobacterium nonmethylotrophicum]TGE00994.1 acyltransferase [Methylobacterium nonmethylotrophicum]